MLAAVLSACAAGAKAPAPADVSRRFDPTDSDLLSAFVQPAPGQPAKRPTSRELVGLSAESVRGLLGEPGLIRREQPAEVWQFLSQRCSLLVYLYPDGPGATARVRHAETIARSRNGTVLDQDCIGELVKAPPKVS